MDSRSLALPITGLAGFPDISARWGERRWPRQDASESDFEDRAVAIGPAAMGSPRANIHCRPDRAAYPPDCRGGGRVGLGLRRDPPICWRYREAVKLVSGQVFGACFGLHNPQRYMRKNVE